MAKRWNLALAPVLALLAAAVWSGVAGAGFSSLEEARAAAIAQNKPLLVDFYAEWCGPCKAFTKAVNEDAEVQGLLESVVLHKVDAEKGEGLGLAKTHNVTSYPTFVLVNADLQPIDRWLGYSKPYLQEMMTLAMADLTPISEKRAALAKAPTAAGASRLARFDAANGDYKAAVALYHQAEKLDPSTSQASNIFDATFSGLRSQAFTKEDAAKAADSVILKGQPGEILNAAAMMTSLAAKEHDQDMMVRYIKAAVEKTEGVTDEYLLAQRNAILPTYALRVEKNAEKAVALRRAGMPAGWMENPEQLNDYAWWAFENQVDLDEALKLARKGADLAPAGKTKAMVLDTAAELCNALDNCHEALDLTKLAMQNDPENEYYKKQLDRFQSILASKN